MCVWRSGKMLSLCCEHDGEQSWEGQRDRHYIDYNTHKVSGRGSNLKDLADGNKCLSEQDYC